MRIAAIAITLVVGLLAGLGIALSAQGNDAPGSGLEACTNGGMGLG